MSWPEGGGDLRTDKLQTAEVIWLLLLFTSTDGRVSELWAHAVKLAWLRGIRPCLASILLP